MALVLILMLSMATETAARVSSFLIPGALPRQATPMATKLPQPFFCSPAEVTKNDYRYKGLLPCAA